MSLGLGLGLGMSIATGFRPSGVAGLVADYDFTDAGALTIVSSVNIQAVRNAVSGSMLCTAPLAGARPIFTDPGGGAKKYAQFNASPHALVTTEAAVVNAFKDSAPLTVLAVVRHDTLLSAATVVGAGASAARPYRLYIRNVNKHAAEQINNAAGSDQLKETGAIADTAKRVVDWRDTGSAIQIGVDGVDRAITGGSSYVTQTPQTFTSVGIGSFLFTGGALSTSAMSGAIWRVLVYSRVLSDIEIGPIRTYLAGAA